MVKFLILSLFFSSCSLFLKQIPDNSAAPLSLSDISKPNITSTYAHTLGIPKEEERVFIQILEKIRAAKITLNKTEESVLFALLMLHTRPHMLSIFTDALLITNRNQKMEIQFYTQKNNTPFLCAIYQIYQRTSNSLSFQALINMIDQYSIDLKVTPSLETFLKQNRDILMSSSLKDKFTREEQLLVTGETLPRRSLLKSLTPYLADIKSGCKSENLPHTLRNLSPETSIQCHYENTSSGRLPKENYLTFGKLFSANEYFWIVTKDQTAQKDTIVQNNFFTLKNKILTPPSYCQMICPNKNQLFLSLKTIGRETLLKALSDKIKECPSKESLQSLIDVPRSLTLSHPKRVLSEEANSEEISTKLPVYGIEALGEIHALYLDEIEQTFIIDKRFNNKIDIAQ